MSSFRTLIACDFALIVAELYFIEDVSVPEHALFQRDDEELALWEVLFYHFADVLGVLEVERCVDLVQDV